MAFPLTKGRALVVIDAQNEYRPGGALEIGYPPFAESLANIGRAMDAARAAAVPLVVVRMQTSPQSALFRTGSPAAELVAEVAGRGHDHLVDKSWPSAFTATDLAAWLRERGIGTLTLAGYMTQNCLLSTALEAMHSGFAVELLADASGAIGYANAAGSASAEEIHRVVCVVLHTRFAAVLETAAWIGHLKAGTTPARDSILASFERARAPAAA